MLKKYNERKTETAAYIESHDLVGEYNINPDVEDSDMMLNVIDKYSTIFSSVPGKIDCLDYEIRVNAETKPIASRPYSVPFHLKKEVKSEIDKWLEIGVIRESSSDWASPLVVVRNTNNSLRLTVDFRKLNPHINTDNYPMPIRETVIENLHKSKIMTKLDLTKAFLQIPLKESSKKFTSFVTPWGQFEFNVVPFGIKFASGLCNRLIKSILKSCDSFVTSFIDDLVIHSDSIEEHLEHVDIVLSKLSHAGVTLNVKKCDFAQTDINFLGVKVGNGNVYPDPKKVEAIRNFQVPTNKKTLRSYLGLLSFYRKFIPNLAMYVSKLTGLLKKGCPDKIRWTDELTDDFKKSRNLICEDAILSLPKPGYKFVVQTDASDDAIGAVLGQLRDDDFVPIAFISRVLNTAEKNYAVVEKECLAVKWAVCYFHDYLFGAKFIVRTDHAPLAWLHKNKDLNSRLMRWALRLQSYDFTIEYIKGTENFIADLLSRCPIVLAKEEGV